MSNRYEEEVYVEITNKEAVTEKTIMQKILNLKQVEDYINGTKKDLTGWASKAKDVAPFAINLKNAYKNLHLDYKNSIFTRMLGEGKGLYILRCTTELPPKNPKNPRLDLGKNPSTLNYRQLGDEVKLIPEYDYGFGQTITDGAIYYIDPESKEYLVAIWNARKYKFDSVQEGR